METQKHHALGRHILIELYDCPQALLVSPSGVEPFLLAAATAMGATVVGSHFHAFSPWGVSGVVIIQESHLTVHTWPEYGYAAVDIFTCGALDMQAGVDSLVADFKAGHHFFRTFSRGLKADLAIENQLHANEGRP